MLSVRWVAALSWQGLAATVEALYPENDLGVPDHRETELDARIRGYLELLPARQRALLVLLFAAAELAGPLLVGRFSRLSRLPPDARVAVVRSLRSSSLGVSRLLGDALKATTTLLYASHPATLEYLERAAPPRSA
ncbi:MAG: hypothetical protein FJ104_07750 [Deltaproteobacteria bacterium]|nr:hypothetical protein [Deltaproteobacteria bacterium]